jgi:serine/threonine protein kinase
MDATLDEFVRDLSASKVLSATDVDAFLQTLPANHLPRDAPALGRELVRAGKLTDYQVELLAQGRGRSLVLGQYLLLDRLGAGGMGQVFKARHRRMDRLVALKILPPAATQSAVAVLRFQREVRTAARLLHPNIVIAHDADEADGVHFLVMEYVDGQDLHSLVRSRGRLPVGEAAGYALQAARGLEYAHAQGVVHRDIKPSNLLVDRHGAVKILDMGLAYREPPAGEGPLADEEGLTGSGQVLGTVDYMPPEQAEGNARADHRSDVYALGCTLYRLLTGEVPYPGPTPVRKMLAHRADPVPSLRARLPDLPAELDAAVRRMMAKDPLDRFPSMREVAAALQPFARPAAPPPEPPPAAAGPREDTGEADPPAPEERTEPIGRAAPPPPAPASPARPSGSLLLHIANVVGPLLFLVLVAALSVNLADSLAPAALDDWAPWLRDYIRDGKGDPRREGPGPLDRLDPSDGPDGLRWPPDNHRGRPLRPRPRGEPGHVRRPEAAPAPGGALPPARRAGIVVAVPSALGEDHGRDA